MKATTCIKRHADHGILGPRRTEALVARAAAGDRRSERTLVRHNIRLICSAVSSVPRTPGWFEDLFQEGQIAFGEAIRSYNPHLAESFASYAYTLVRRRIARSLKAKKHAPLGAPFGIPLAGHWEEVLEIPAGPGTEEAAIRNCEAQEAASHLATLSRREHHIVRSYYGLDAPQRSMIQLARDHDVSQEWVRRLHWRAIGKLRHGMKAEDPAA